LGTLDCPKKGNEGQAKGGKGLFSGGIGGKVLIDHTWKKRGKTEVKIYAIGWAEETRNARCTEGQETRGGGVTRKIN